MDRINTWLEIDAEEGRWESGGFLRRKLNEVGKQEAIIGISGCLASTIAGHVPVKAVGAEKVRLPNAPES